MSVRNCKFSAKGRTQLCSGLVLVSQSSKLLRCHTSTAEHTLCCKACQKLCWFERQGNVWILFCTLSEEHKLYKEGHSFVLRLTQIFISTAYQFTVSYLCNLERLCKDTENIERLNCWDETGTSSEELCKDVQVCDVIGWFVTQKHKCQSQSHKQTLWAPHTHILLHTQQDSRPQRTVCCISSPSTHSATLGKGNC